MTENYNFGMTSVLAEALNRPKGEIIREYFITVMKYGWNFNRWYEKLIIIICFLWAIASIILLLCGIITFK